MPNKSMHQTISLICTVRDEADNIATLLESMLAQTRLPDEIIINDCLSRDETPLIVRDYAARHPRIRLVFGGHNIPSGRNSAIRAARGTLIACTDAGLTLDAGWLAAIVAPLEAGTADLVGGFFRPVAQTLFELTLGAVNYRDVTEVDPVTFLPFGKSMAFRRELWERVGGFPEQLSHCEDLVFDLAAEAAGFRRAFVPDALVLFRPRSSWRAFARQYYLYARGDGAARLWTRRHLARYTAYSALIALLILATRHRQLRLPVAVPLVIGTAGYTFAPYRRLWPRLVHHPIHQRLIALAFVPLIRLVGDLAKMVGYPAGRLRSPR